MCYIAQKDEIANNTLVSILVSLSIVLFILCLCSSGRIYKKIQTRVGIGIDQAKNRGANKYVAQKSKSGANSTNNDSNDDDDKDEDEEDSDSDNAGNEASFKN